MASNIFTSAPRISGPDPMGFGEVQSPSSVWSLGKGPMWMAQKSHGYRMLNHVKSFFGPVRSPVFGCLNIWHRLELCFNTYDKKCSKWLCLLLKIQMAVASNPHLPFLFHVGSVPMFPSVFVYLLSSFLLRSKFPIFAESKSYVCCFFPRCSPIFPMDSGWVITIIPRILAFNIH